MPKFSRRLIAFFLIAIVAFVQEFPRPCRMAGHKGLFVAI
jgi:hypothetical protein